MDLSTSGADDFLALSKRLKAAGNKGMRNELNKQIRKAAKPAVKAVRQAAIAGLPAAGGLGSFVAKKRASVVTRTGSDPGVKVRINKQDPRLDTQGRLVHPVFGRRPSVVQQVRPGVMSEGFQRAAPEIRKDVLEALESVKRQVIGRG